MIASAPPSTIAARAPGKVILLGEHSVVYGHPALAGALAAGVVVEATAGRGLLRIPAWGVSVRGDDPGPLGRAYAAILERLARIPGWIPPEVDLCARFEIPTGAGLGSSAALSVAIVRALAQAAGRAVDTDVVLDAAMAAENVFHGRASGIDHAVAAQGGFGMYTRAGGLQGLRAAQPVPLVVGHTGRERDTKGRVARVAELSGLDETRGRFAAIAGLVQQAATAIAEGNFGALGTAMDENQRHLAALEVSCPEIETMCALARDAGAIGAKLTGGGGGGCVIALAPGPGPTESVRSAWARAGFSSFTTEVAP